MPDAPLSQVPPELRLGHDEAPLPSVLVPRGPCRERGRYGSRLERSAGVFGAGLLTGMGAALATVFETAGLFEAGVIGTLAGAGAALLRPTARAAWQRTRARARLQEADALTDGGGTHGQLARVKGVVQPARLPFRTPAGRSAVLVRYVGRLTRLSLAGARHRPLWEVHAVDFRLVTRDGREVLVDATEIRLLPHPPPFEPEKLEGRGLYGVPLDRADTGEAPRFTRIFIEDVIAPGDAVEAVGILEIAPGPEGQAIRGRGRLVLRLRPGGGVPVLVSRAG